MRRLSAAAWILLGLSLSTVRAQAPPGRLVTFTILHVNDVYEINPLGADAGSGGLARLAGLRKELLKENPNTYTVLAGDLFSPSPMGLLPPSAPWRGKQIVDVMNAAGLDLAVLGNHEFDVKPADFAARIQESKFRWISANVTNSDREPIPGVAPFLVREFEGAGGAKARVAFVGLTVDSNRAKWVAYSDPYETARRILAELRGRADFVVGLTHLDLGDDLRLARDFPEIRVILGGHEHEAHNNPQTLPGRPTAVVFKADSNAVTAWVHRFKVDLDARAVELESRIVRVDAKIPDDPETAGVVKGWNDRFEVEFDKRFPGKKPNDVLKTFEFKLEGKDSLTRTGPTNLGRFIARTMLATLPPADAKDARPRVALLNSGSIRIDDDIPPGIPLRYYDVLRILPYGGPVKHVRMTGALLRRVLEQSEATMKEKGGYLQYAGVVREGDAWKVGDAPIDDATSHLVALSDYLFQGAESGYEYLNVGGKLAEGMTLEPNQPPDDVQKLVVEALKALAPNDPAMKAERVETLTAYEPTATIRFPLDSFVPPSAAPPATPTLPVAVAGAPASGSLDRIAGATEELAKSVAELNDRVDRLDRTAQRLSLVLTVMGFVVVALLIRIVKTARRDPIHDFRKF